jgi:WD40 repeat protein
MSTSASGADPLGRLADEFLERRRRGERPTLTEYAARHPELAKQIRELFPALVLMEEVRPEPLPGPGALAEAPPPLEGPLLRLGEYCIIREIGRGGMGVVFEAEQESLSRRVALKVLPPGALQDARHIERFQREARAAARLHHTNIVPVFGVGEEGGTHYYVMQYIEGCPLDEVLCELRRLRGDANPQTEVVTESVGPAGAEGPSSAQVARSLQQGSFRQASKPEAVAAADPAEPAQPDRDAGPPTPLVPCPPGSGPTPFPSPLSNPDYPYAKSVAQIGVQVAEGLEYAAGQGVLHRDVKPSNLLLDVWGTVWLTDFGLAKVTGTPDLTRTGDLLGTLRYLAPERFEGRADVRSDVYALGLTLYEMLALRPAFSGDDQAELVRQITTAEVPRLDQLYTQLPKDLVTIVHKATARDPADRYQTAGALAEDMRRFLDDRSILARRAGVLERGWRWCRRNRALAASLGATVLALVAGSAFALLFAYGEKAARRRADQRERDAKGSEARAVKNAKEARREVEKLYVANGRREEDEGNLFGALLWLARPLAGENGPAVDEATHRLRLGCYFRYARRPTLVQVLYHQETVQGAAFSPDGRRILTVGRERTAQIWDAVTGRRLATLPHEGPVRHGALSPDGRMVVTASADHTARIWDAMNGRLLFSLEHRDEVAHAAFSPDSRSVITSCSDRSARVWDVATGKERHPPLMHGKPVRLALFSPDGRWILTCTDDKEGRVLCWDAKEPKDRADGVLQYSKEKTGRVLWVAFSRDGRRVVITDDHRGAHVWDMATRHRTLLLKHPGFSVLCAAFSPNNRRLVTADWSGTVRLWDATTGEPASVILQHQGKFVRVAFSPDGGRLATADSDRRAQVWDTATGEPVTPALLHQGFVREVAFSPDGDRFLTASEDGTVRVWDMTSEGAFTRVLAHARGLKEASFSPDGSRVVTASLAGTVRVWDAVTGRPVSPPVRHQGWALSAAFSPDGRRVVSTGADGTVRVWDAATGKDLTRPFRQPPPIHSASFSPDGHRIVTAGADGAARVWDAATGELQLPLLKHKGEVRAAVFSPDGRRIATASDDGTAQLWDAGTGKAVGPPLRHGGGVICAVFSRDGRRLVTGGQAHDGVWFGEARVWDAVTGRPLWSVRSAGAVSIVAFSPDGSSVVIAGHGETARVYDAVTGRPLSPAWGHGFCAAFSPDGRFVATGGFDRSARVWEVATGQPVTPPLWHWGPVLGVSFSPDGRTLLTCSSDGTARLWDLIPDDRPAADLVLLAQLLAGHRLDAQGALDWLSPKEQGDALAKLRKKYPAEFSVRPAQAMAWHRLEANKRLFLGDFSSALFHYLHGSPVWPLLHGVPRLR